MPDTTVPTDRPPRRRPIDPDVEQCHHNGDTVKRVAHGHLGDAPAGTVETLCADCGAVV